MFRAIPGDDPCCDVTVTALPVNLHYMQANAAWRKDHCANVTCPRSARPGPEPPSCAFVPRCDRGACSNTCPP